MSQRTLPKRTRCTIGHIVIGNPENRRVRFFQEALCRAKLPRALEVSYEQILRFSLDPTPSGSHPLVTAIEQVREGCSKVFLRIESAGESFEVDRLMLALGASKLPERSISQSISAKAAMRLRYDRGRLRYLRQYFAGFEATMLQLQRLTMRNDLHTYNSVPSILVACDKVRCNQFLQSKSIPCTPAMQPVSDFEDLIDRMRELGWKRVFVKHAHGSSAAGVIAVDASGDKIRATTTMEMTGSGVKTRFHNNLKLRTYQKVGQIRRLVEFLCGEGVQVEQWLPRACHQGRVFDLRMVVIGGQCTHAVVRTSRSPITNLHLGNKRGDLTALKQAMGSRAWQRIVDVAEQAAAALPGSLYLGIDLLLQPNFRAPTVIEVNAFGDLLPGILHNGRSTYEMEIQKLCSTTSLNFEQQLATGNRRLPLRCAKRACLPQ